jgi:hypothetical protein
MSIINDALKKVQMNMSGSPDNKGTPETPLPMSNGAAEFAHTPTPSPSPASSATPPTPPPAPDNKDMGQNKEAKPRLVYILGVLCLLTALFAPILNHQSVFGMLWQKVTKKTSHSPRTAASRPKAAAASPSVAQQAVAIKEEITKSIVNMGSASPAPSSSSSRSTRRIMISGILAQGDKNVVLIDGQVYETGETVEGLKIVAINANNIVVEDVNGQRTLKVGQ